jgi:hypothetical protein
VRRLGTALLAVLMLALGAGPAAAAEDEFHFFEISVLSQGKLEADYGKELQPGLSTAAGIDGFERLSWKWEVRATALSVGGSATLRTSAALFRAKVHTSADVFSYTVQMGVPDVDQLCDGRQDLSTDGFVQRPGTRITLHGRGTLLTPGFTVRRPFTEGQFPDRACMHPSGEDGLRYYDSGFGLPVARGAFNPRSDRHFSKTYSSDASHPVAPRGDHSAAASSTVTITVRAVSERRFQKATRKYQGYPRGRLRPSGPRVAP